MWHLVSVFCIAECLVCLLSVNSILHTRQSAIQNPSVNCHIKYSSSSWWWTWRGLKHVEVINNIDEIHWEKIVHQNGFIYKIIYRWTVNRTLKKRHDIWGLYETLSRKFQISLQSDKNNGYCTWRLYAHLWQ